MAAKICYNCGKKLHGDGIHCTNCGAHQWREGTESMNVEQLKEKADDEFRQAKLAKGNDKDTFMEMAMYHYFLIAERIHAAIPKLEAVEPMERSIHMLEYILMQERRAEAHGNEVWQQSYREMIERLTNMKDNLLYERIEKNRIRSEETEETPASAKAADPKTMDSDKIDELVDYAIFTVSEMDEMGSWTFLGKARNKNYMTSMFSFLRDIKNQIPTLEERERGVMFQVMFQVGDSYEKGTYPFPQDPVRAIEWHTEAAKRGFVLSDVRIGEIYMKGSGGMRPQPEKALEYFERALKAENTSQKISEYAEAAIEHIKYTMRAGN